MIAKVRDRGMQDSSSGSRFEIHAGALGAKVRVTHAGQLARKSLNSNKTTTQQQKVGPETTRPLQTLVLKRRRGRHGPNSPSGRENESRHPYPLAALFPLRTSILGAAG